MLRLLLTFTAVALLARLASANIPGGGGGQGGQGPDVTVVDHHDGTVTLANGIVSIVIDTKKARLDRVTYTHKNDHATRTSDVLLPSSKGRGQYYYGGFSLGSGAFEYTLATDPAANGGALADVKLLSDSQHNGVMEVHFSMLRGSPGFYSTAIMTHRRQDVKFEVGAWGVITRVTPDFNWLSADAARNFFIGRRSSKGAKVPDAPHESTILLDGAQQSQYANKFIYGQDHADLRAWGWSSVGTGGLNIGVWLMTNMEFSDGGPLKRDVSVYPYSELNNSILTGELGMGSDGFFADGETWTKTCGPWFYYLNDVPPTITDAKQAAHLLQLDALAQAEAEAKAWPYAWFKHPNYVSAAGRGTVKGKIVIKDPGNPNASAVRTWVGLEQQPQTIKGFYDFQKWLKPYQFWVQTDADGSFTLPNVIAGENYTLWAYGPGAAGTFMSQEQTGGKPPLEYTLPVKPFAVTVTAGRTSDLGIVTWTPKRVGATVFELGLPNRKADEFRHGDDFWCPAPAPKVGYPTPVWGGQVEFPLDFPDGTTYTVGKSRWAIDWNYVLPSVPDHTGAWQPAIGKINFDLAKAPSDGAAASLYLGCAGDDGGHIIISINGVNLGSAQGVTAGPQPIDASGFNPAYFDDASIHLSNHGPFSDERINFPAKMLHAGQNSITIQMDARKLTAYLMLDYLRLEMTGYVPPAPVGVTACAGNNRALVCWPLVPGATSYSLFRATSRDGKYMPVVTGLLAPISGSGPSIWQYVDRTAMNGLEYTYRAQAVNPTGSSEMSLPSNAITPSPKQSTAAPAAPASLKVTASGHHQVTLAWTASPGANFYRIWRTTLHSDSVGGNYPIGRAMLDDTDTGPAYTDRSPTDGREYGYAVEAVNAAGTSPLSPSVTAQPLPAPPAAAPQSLTARWSKTRDGKVVTLNWSPVDGAIGYVIYRSSGPAATFTWPDHYLTELVETTYIDKGVTEKSAPVKGLDASKDYDYQVSAVNAAGVSPPATIHVPAR
ncbi:MAG TPA: polysaccharide lyase family protein [Tepidisphaeraceae bacterium]|nr:polysaccharide lyase family protein [Tepidisphaeraceae bacterium]